MIAIGKTGDKQSRMELGLRFSLDCTGRTIWIADAHRGDGKR